MAAIALAAYVVWFLGAFVVRSIIQKQSTGDSGLRAGALRAGTGSLEWCAGWLFVVAIIASLAAPIAELVGYAPLTTNTLWRGIGLAVAAIGVVLTFVAQAAMGSDWRIGIDATEQTGLVTDGPFSLVRNPIFTAMIIAAIGLTMTVPNPISILALTSLAAAIEIQVRFVEEPHLRRHHGNDYTTYAGRVGRFIPRPPRN